MALDILFIPDEDKIYLRISGNMFGGLEYSPSMIRQQGNDGISVDWDEYSSAQDCLNRGTPEVDGVVSFNVGCIRNLNIPISDLPPYLEVLHQPIHDNYSHSIIVKLPGSNRKSDVRIIRNLIYGCVKLEIHSPAMIDNLS